MRNRSGNNVLTRAMFFNHKAPHVAVKLLLDDGRCDVNACDNTGWTALTYAIMWAPKNDDVNFKGHPLDRINALLTSNTNSSQILDQFRII